MQGEGGLSSLSRAILQGEGKQTRFSRAILQGEGKQSRLRNAILQGEGGLSSFGRAILYRLNKSILQGEGRTRISIEIVDNGHGTGSVQIRQVQLPSQIMLTESSKMQGCQ